jgi:hypothetical protein
VLQVGATGTEEEEEEEVESPLTAQAYEDGPVGPKYVRQLYCLEVLMKFVALDGSHRQYLNCIWKASCSNFELDIYDSDYILGFWKYLLAHIELIL